MVTECCGQSASIKMPCEQIQVCMHACMHGGIKLLREHMIIICVHTCTDVRDGLNLQCEQVFMCTHAWRTETASSSCVRMIVGARMHVWWTEAAFKLLCKQVRFKLLCEHV